MADKSHTNLYVSIRRDIDNYIDNLRVEKIRADKKNYTKADIIKYLIDIGIEVIEGRYLKLDPNIDEFVSKLQVMVLEMEGQRVEIKKSKEQVYNMIIEKGLQHLSDEK